ncbi:nibrin homolog [Rutidosis leptorrhynchoides]|uniref:nibrin homolog n=1 Tax=Rutidosis leptorrhynchoides TaxID=125765 RepID=UPI003A997AC3
MVWGLTPIDSQSGENEYYVFKPGTYKVGRKGCDIIVNKDKGVSRIHAEIKIDTMQRKYSDASKVQIKDCSKYGTFVTRNFGSKEKVQELPNKETTLKEGDLVSFGTSITTYRFCFVPLVFWVCCDKSSQVKNLLEENISLIGAHGIPHWNEECTHVVVDELVPATEELLEAIVSKRPFVLSSWIEFVAEKSIRTEIPSCSAFLPMVSIEGVSAKVVDPRARENCLKGYTFLLEAPNSYFYSNKLQRLLETSGAKVFSVESFQSSSQGPKNEDQNRLICVIPNGAADKFAHVAKCSSLLRVNETDIISAVLSGHLDPALLTTPCVIISSSCSTDETIVADSDAENETATSDPPTKESFPAYDIKPDISSANEIKGDISMDHISMVPENASSLMHEESDKSKTRSQKHAESATTKMDYVCLVKHEDINTSKAAKVQKLDDYGAENMDIIYSQDLIVQNLNLHPTMISSAVKDNVTDFKRFRKANTQSGNSFNNLIPFSKFPYKDSEYTNEEMAEAMKEEKRRKQMEAVSEDLFNNEKGRRRGVAGSLQGLLIRR